MTSFAREVISTEALTNFSHYIYFMYCSTALYRSSYPRRVYKMDPGNLLLALDSSTDILWSQTRARNDNPPQRNRQESHFIVSLYAVYYSAGVSGFYSLVVFAFGWQNLMSELVGFGDRQLDLEYYRWTSLNKFFVTWNKMIQGWLSETVFFPLEDTFGIELAALMVMTYSGLMHEYVYIHASTCLIPLYTLQFSIIGLLPSDFISFHVE